MLKAFLNYGLVAAVLVWAGLVATAAGHALSVRHDQSSVLVSSEPLDDDPAWRPVPDRTLLTATATDLTLTTLGVP